MLAHNGWTISPLIPKIWIYEEIMIFCNGWNVVVNSHTKQNPNKESVAIQTQSDSEDNSVLGAKIYIDGFLKRHGTDIAMR